MLKKISDKQKERNKDKANEAQQMHTLFKEIWDEQEDEGGYCYCFETGRAMHGSTYRNNTSCYDHVLEKGKASYPQYKKVKKNIVILHPSVHMQKGVDIDKCPKLKVYREKLLQLHREGKLYDTVIGDERTEEEGKEGME